MKSDVVLLKDEGHGICLNVEAGKKLILAVDTAFNIDLTLQEGSCVELLRFICDDGKNQEPKRFSLKVIQKGDSVFKSFFFVRGEVYLQDDIVVFLQGQGAEVYLNGLHDVKKNADVQTKTLIKHLAERTKSDQLYKAVLEDDAFFKFLGRIYVDSQAQQTNAYQLNQNILLSDRARVESRPELEIFADNVKCSHGSATGQMREEELFYLQTRAIAKQDAQKMLIKGFMNDVISRIDNEELHQMIHRYI